MDFDKIIDISPLLSPTTPVWPGDTPLQQSIQMELARGDSVNLSSLTSTVHIGAHADAPYHFASAGAEMASVNLSPYLGPCYVLHTPTQGLIEPKHLANLPEITPSRILFRTGSFDHNRGPFDDSFAAFSPQTIDFLAERGVTLVGIDTPSVDPFSSKDLPTHHKLLEHDIRNLEGLDLDNVAEGAYTLIALPLRLVGFDGSPVRAVLLPG